MTKSNKIAPGYGLHYDCALIFLKSTIVMFNKNLPDLCRKRQKLIVNNYRRRRSYCCVYIATQSWLLRRKGKKYNAIPYENGNL